MAADSVVGLQESCYPQCARGLYVNKHIFHNLNRGVEEMVAQLVSFFNMGL